MVEFGVALSVVLSLLAAATAVFTLLVHVRYPDLSSLVGSTRSAHAAITALTEELEAVRDAQEHAQRRAAARVRREGATARAEGAAAGPADGPAYARVSKADLRALAAGRFRHNGSGNGG